MLVSSKKSKARVLQQWVRDQILSQFPFLEADDVKSTPMGVNGLDIQLSKIARNTVPVGVECKNFAKFAVYTHYEQAVRNTYKYAPHSTPVLILKGNHKKPLALVDAEFFFQLMRNRYDASLINLNEPDKDATQI